LPLQLFLGLALGFLLLPGRIIRVLLAALLVELPQGFRLQAFLLLLLAASVLVILTPLFVELPLIGFLLLPFRFLLLE
jgi:hypothetical protein